VILSLPALKRDPEQLRRSFLRGLGDVQPRLVLPRPFGIVQRGTQQCSRSWFRFGPGGGEMISITSRAGAAAFFTDVDREVSPTEPDFGILLGVAAAHGLTVPVSAN